MRSIRLTVSTGLVALVLLMTASPASKAAESVEDFYKKHKILTILIGFGPGTGYDVWARAIAQRMADHIPGKPSIIIKNMPGAGSLIMANHLYNTAPKDGSVLGSFSRNIPSQAMLGIKNAKFDPRDFEWIGSPELPIRVCGAMTKTGISTVEDLQKKQLIVGGTGPATSPTFLPPMLNQIAGTKFKVIDGYQSADEVYLAMQRGEVDGLCQSYGSLVRGTADLLKAGKFKLLFNVESVRSPLLKGAPSIHEYVKNAKDKQLLNFINSSTELGRPIAAPPGVPADRLAALRKAFMATMVDPDFIKIAAKQKLEIAVTSGEELQERVKLLYTIPKDTIDRANALIGKRKKKK